MNMKRTPPDPTTRFSDRVDNYSRCRPGYPDSVLQILEKEIGLTPESVIADIGSGTGISSELFLKHGNRVFAVEPNPAMRGAAESLLRNYAGFFSVPGTAEQTTLGDQSVDDIVACQAFHWFDHQRSREEFARILRPAGYVILLWNTRRVESTPFLAEYEQLLTTHGTDYTQVNHRNIDDRLLRNFFASGKYAIRKLDNEQLLDYDGLEGRLLSSSYVPNKNEAGFQPMLAALKQIFESHNENGFVRMEYDTEIYWGHVAPLSQKHFPIPAR